MHESFLEKPFVINVEKKNFYTITEKRYLKLKKVGLKDYYKRIFYAKKYQIDCTL